MSSERTDGSSRGADGGTTDGSDSSEGPSWRRISERVVPEYVDRRFGAQVGVAMLAVAVVVCLASVVAYAQVQNAVTADAREDIATTTDLRATSVAEWIEGTRSRTAMLARGAAAGQQDPETVEAFLSMAVDSDATTVAAVHYVDAGRIVASTREGYDGRFVSSLDVPWQDLSPGGSVAVTDRAYDVGEQPVLGFVAAAGGARLVVEASLPGALADGNQRVESALFSADGERVAGAAEIPPPPSGVGIDGRRTLLDGEAFRSYAPVAGTDLVIATAAPRSALTGLGGVVVWGLLGVVLLGIVSLALAGALVSRRTVVALEELRRRTAEVEAGNLDVDLSTDREDEIGHLYEGVASMRDALRGQVQQARAAKREAEQSHDEMERQNRRLDQFASTLSHDLRNPLAVARGHVELLSAKLEDDSLQEHVSKIDGAHDRIDSIIGDVLTLTREGESVEETERFDLREVAEEAWSNVDNKDATLEFEESIAIDADRCRVLRAFENLFRNAIDHVGPEVSVTVGLTRDGFYVEDDGPGIPDEEMDSIFEYGHTTSDDGTGLGLSIVRTIAEAHGWSLWVDATTGGGARFVFSDVFKSEERLFEKSAFSWVRGRRVRQ